MKLYVLRLKFDTRYFFLENLGVKQLGSIVYITGSDRYRKVEDT